MMDELFNRPSMAIVTVKNKFQIVIPQAVRKQLGIRRGDVLEARVERGKLTYTRKRLLDDKIPATKAGERFLKQLRSEAPAWLKEIWTASQSRGTDKLTMQEIDAEVASIRRSSKKRARPAR